VKTMQKLTGTAGVILDDPEYLDDKVTAYFCPDHHGMVWGSDPLPGMGECGDDGAKLITLWVER